jgi:glutamyl-tRNA reductase
MLSKRQLSPILDKRPTPLLVIDLGVPRNLDPLMAERDGLEPIFLDQVHELMRDHATERGSALDKAATIVAEEATHFEQWLRRLPLRPLRAEMYNSLEKILARWRSTQPRAVRHLRVSLHRSLEQAFRGIDIGAGNSTPINQ